MAIAVATAPPAAASHFRAAQLSWSRADSTTRTVTFEYSGTFRRSYFATSGPGPGPFAGPYPAPGPGVGQVVNVGAPIVYGDGTQSATVNATVETVDAVNDTITVEASVAHTYAGTASSFLASFENCCRLSAPQHRNNPDKGFRVETQVSLASGVTRSPDSAVSPIVDCPVSALCQFFLPAADADGGTLSWAFASSIQASGSTGPFVQPSGATVNPTTGLYRWNTTGASLNPSGASYFSTQVIITDVLATGAKSTVAVDFFLRVTDTASPDRPPAFVDPTPADGTVINALPNIAVTFDTAAADPDAGDNVTLGLLGAPASSTFTTTPANPAAGHFSWTPTTPGTTIVTLTAQDPFGLQATQRSVIIKVGDNVPPVVSVPKDMTVEATSASGAAVTFNATAQDNVDGTLTPTCTPASGSTFTLGTTPVSCSATDSSGNTGTAGFNVTVQDTTGPVISGLTNLKVEAQNANGATVAFSPTAIDAVDGPRPVTCTPPSGSTFALGGTTVSCSSTDTRGNLSSGMFTVTVEDTTAPVITTPGDQTVEATGPSGATVTYTATAADAVDGAVNVTCTPASGSTFPLGDTTVSCSAADAAGNTAGATFVVHVVDTTPPALSLPGDTTVEASGPAGAVVSYQASATDLVDGTLTPSCDTASGSQFALGDTTVHCTVTDAHGNKASGSFVVHVVDTTPPHVAVPADMTVEATGPSGAAASFQVTATDVVDGSVSATCAPASGATFPLGDTTVNCSATDAHGNKASGSFVVHVVDTTPPALSGPAGVTAEATGPGGAHVSFTVTATDVVDGTVPVTCTPGSGSAFGLGTTIVSCSATDAHGNTGTTNLPVTVQDTTPPQLHLPSDVTVEATSPGGAAVSYNASATDLVDGTMAASCSPASGATFPFGTTTVNCTATDAHGNSANGSFKVTVRDTTPPTITWSGNNGTYGITDMVNITCSATDTGSGVATANCPNISGPASSFALGVNTFNASATDKAGNTATSSTSFTVAATPDSLCALTRSYVANQGLADAFCAKLTAAAAAAARGDKTGANVNLVNFQNQVSAQSGKALTADHAANLIRLAKALAASW
ncbi:MAG TPA: HYR domain-containing protein [Acidimicrobiales bacterium]|nr:HYR domain-containing protein [Acidimicrobiales bacterium]